ncbi:succinate dehydrogenase / fumarate reductase cytochrome b subunit [Kaistella treverensis]|uniref:Succinate dehydrogenase / fumarate reductase cytochrome b subunit n=1 Tax=Kaistella treverensis TaxID=631455 RepID=A0A1I3MUT5_9FLAO|nr:succinate dehydrogenase cytochrome b subunit [Kaistella treverensis]SFJ00778.1 succinate dehydrogenase / fumarate reductase cytochrome b subunit [Kaistella treverensis]
MAGFTTSTIGRKYAMALSAMFLLLFLIMHLSVNLLSLGGENGPFNAASYFMGYNPLVQFVMQPILVIGVIFHFVMGFVLEIQNNKARPIKYGTNNRAANSTWMSRNMLITGAVILAFLVLHMYDFWVHEMTYKYVPGEGDAADVTRFWGELHAKFAELWRVVLYVISFVLLGLHLAHGFQSSFQSVGARHPKYTPVIKAIGTWYSILIPAGFIFIAVFHYVTQ